MSDQSQQLVKRLWNYCNLLRDDGLSYGDYVEQLTYLLFLKMSHEQTQPPHTKSSPIPKEYDWQSLLEKEGDELLVHYRRTLDELGKRKGMLGLIFSKALNKIQNAAKLRRLIKELIDQQTWTGLATDVKGAAYEGLLEKNAQDTKSGAGQYFTPRPVIHAVVKCIRPRPGETVCDPACGTGGFLLAAHDYIADKKDYKLDKSQKKKLRLETLYGFELVDSVTRLCAMNLMLHGIGPLSDDEGEPPVKTGDSLESRALGGPYDIVLTNPPFGKKSSVMIVAEPQDDENGNGKKGAKAKREALTFSRSDFWATTSNKQLNFLQLVKTMLAVNGRAAVVVPDNVLFEGGAGETIRRKLLAECDVHTVLRLPTGLFYAQGVKANVLFFDRQPPSETPQTKDVWFYDFRTDIRFTLKTKQLREEDLDEFVRCYNPENRHDRKPTWTPETPQGRWRSYSLDDILKRDKASLDIFWLKESSPAGEYESRSLDEITMSIIGKLRYTLKIMEEFQADSAARSKTPSSVGRQVIDTFPQCLE